jgi:hypothetical protein
MSSVAHLLFRAFSAPTIHVRLPGPMAQAITFRAFGAEPFGLYSSRLRLALCDAAREGVVSQ